MTLPSISLCKWTVMGVERDVSKEDTVEESDIWGLCPGNFWQCLEMVFMIRGWEKAVGITGKGQDSCYPAYS